jgi:uncharacterized protein YaaN involved in tellurite resistance
MSHIRLYLILLLFSITQLCNAQADSVLLTLQQLPLKYINQVNSKIDKYTTRITSKTEKTLTKLARWEAKIKTLLEKASPETAQRLFSNTTLSFAAALEKYKNGEALLNNQRAKYNEYQDKLTTSIKYLETQKEKLNAKLIQPLKTVKEQIQKLEDEEDATD